MGQHLREWLARASARHDKLRDARAATTCTGIPTGRARGEDNARGTCHAGSNDSGHRNNFARSERLHYARVPGTDADAFHWHRIRCKNFWVRAGHDHCSKGRGTYR